MNVPRWLAVLVPTRRKLFLLVGHVCVLLGLIALILPVIPTSPFLILGAACYARSSEKFYNMLIENRHFGAAILKWERERCMERKIKIGAILLLAAAFLGSTFLFLQTPTARTIMLGTGLALMLMVYFIPTCRDTEHDGQTSA